jgi:hypothetical protein
MADPQTEPRDRAPRGGRRPGAGQRLEDFLRDYTAGVSREGFRRLMRRDAAEAYAVLTRDQPPGAEPTGGPARFFNRVRVLFLGLSYKLTPVRRLLFAGAIVAAVLNLGQCGLDLDRNGDGGVSLQLDGSPLWSTVSIGLLVFLLALELVDRVRVRDELEVARQLQRDLLPERAPEVPGWRFAHSYRTANEIGGDYYDFALLPDGRLALVSGDASGHGMAAGLLMAIANATLQTAITADPSPRAVAGQLNRTLCVTGGPRAFMTLFYGLLDPASGRLDYLCAGHPFPLLRRAAGGVEELGRGGLPLGLRPGLEIAPAATVLAQGDLLLLYTDGLPEALDPGGQAFGFERLSGLLAQGGGAAAVHDRVAAALDRHTRDATLADDVSLVAVERLAEGQPIPPPAVD